MGPVAWIRHARAMWRATHADRQASHTRHGGHRHLPSRTYLGRWGGTRRVPVPCCSSQRGGRAIT